MKLFSVSIGLLLAALGVFYVPVSFSVDGFGLVVNPGGVRTIRASEPGLVLHFPSSDQRFLPGEIVTAIVYDEAVVENTLQQGTLRREMAKIETDHLDKTSKIIVDLERDRAKKIATAELLKARTKLTDDTSLMLAALQEFTSDSVSDISDLNEERLSQLSKLEDLVKRSGEISALPAQRLATMLEDIQGSRLSVITSKGTRFSSEKMILDMVKGLNDLTFSNSIDNAEIQILSDRLESLSHQLDELNKLRDSMQAEAEARYLAKILLPQVAVADTVSVDMRTLQANRADVEKSEALRLLATGEPLANISFLVYGAPASGEILLRYGTHDISLLLPADPETMAATLRDAGLNVVKVHIDQEMVVATDIISLYVELGELPDERLAVISNTARDAQGLPILVTADVSLPKNFGMVEETETVSEIIGFLENRHAVVLKTGQEVRGSISDTRTGADLVFDATLLDRDYSTVDTKELGIRLGNQSLAAKIIKRGVLSQVVIGVDADSAEQIQHLPGAVVHLSFPLARQSLFNFLLARNAAI